jgi:hypothetical protein
VKVTTVGLDLAKGVFTVHGVDERGNTCRGGPSSAPVVYHLARAATTSRAWHDGDAGARAPVARSRREACVGPGTVFRFPIA